MSRLMDADAIGLNDFEIILCDGSYKEALKMLLNKIETAPTVEIIRCRDCKRYNRHDHRCTVFNHGIHTDDWCSRAERREDEEIDS